MKELKNIEKLFQEKFELLERNPPQHIWENIAEQLQKKKNKRILPIWFQYGAVASLVIIVGLGIYFISTKNTETIKVQEDQVVIDDNLNDVQKKKINSMEVGNEVKNQESANPEEKLNDLKLENPKDIRVEVVDNFGNAKAGKTNASTENSNIKSNSNKNLIVKENERVIVNNSNTPQNQSTKEENDIQKFKPINNDLLAKTLENKVAEEKNKSLNQDKLNLKKELVFTDDKLKTNIDFQEDKDSNSMTRQPIENFLDSSIQKTHEDFKIHPETNNLNPVAIEEVKPNILEDLLIEKEKSEDVVVSKQNKWEIQSNVAPVYFNSLAEGSTIDSEFAGNDKTYQTNFSIGLGVQYAVNDRISIRTGVNRFSLGYNTNDVAFGANFQGKTLEHVNHSAIGATISVKKIVVSENNIQETFSSENTGYLNQRIGYFEVPFEMSYQMLDKKLGISIIGGMSSLFLVENQISVVSTDFSTPIGEANNLNSLSFSTNVGLGFDYPFWKSFHAHFEPVLKYQLNTFNSNVAGFKPFFVGLYTGISYRF